MNSDKPVGDRSRYVVLGSSPARQEPLAWSLDDDELSAGEGRVRTRTVRRIPLRQGSRRSRPDGDMPSSTNIARANPADSPCNVVVTRHRREPAVRAYSTG